MLSSKLVQSIEDHSETISASIVHALRHDPRLPHVSMLPEDELRDRTQDILRRLGHWLLVSKLEEVAAHFERIGKKRHLEAVPLCEVALVYQIVKRRLIQFMRDQGFHETPMELYGEEELEHAVSMFFDAILYHMIKGYEESAHGHLHGRAASAKS